MFSPFLIAVLWTVHLFHPAAAVFTINVIDVVLKNPQLVGAALGLLTPLLVEVIKQPGLSKTRQKFLAYGVAGLLGLLTVIAAGQFNAADLSSTVLIVIAASQAAYAEVYKESGINTLIAAKTIRAKYRKTPGATDG